MARTPDETAEIPREAKRRLQKRWPFVKRRVYPNGSAGWMVDARTAKGGERKTFGTLIEAQTFAEKCRVRRENEGVAAFGNEELARYGKTVQDAISFYLDHLRTQERSVPVSTAVVELIASRQASGKSAEYCAGLKTRLQRLEKAFGDRSAASVTPKELDEWLVGLACAPSTRNTFRRDAQTLFSFCQKRGYTTSNPARETEIAKDVDKPVGILTVRECKRILDACTQDVLPYAAIGLFAGLRAAEVEKLDWSEVDLAGGFIEVKAQKAKTARRRLVRISDNLRAWLEPHAKTSGTVVPLNLRRRWNAALEKAGFRTRLTAETAKHVVWPRNALRHSYGSYWLAQHQDAAALALQMGNSPAMVFAHYRELVRPQQAAEFWAIRPQG